MNNWRPSEGLRRAEPIVRRLIEDSAAASLEIRDPVFAHHVTAVLAGAIDQALADGSEMDALSTVVGNGRVLRPAGEITAPDMLAPTQDGNDADPVPAYRMPEDDIARLLAIQAAERGAVEAFGPKKRRGRPPGPGKKAKKAKAGKPAAATAADVS